CSTRIGNRCTCSQRKFWYLSAPAFSRKKAARCHVRRAVMQDESTLVHCEHVSVRSFDEVVAAFEAAVGTVNSEVFRKVVEASTGPDDFEARMRGSEGPSGFILFFQADHGAWMARVGFKARARLYIVGNPLIARTM